MEKYYIMVNGGQQGPFTAQEIIKKGFSNDSYIYNKELGDWKKISEVADFSSFEKKNEIKPQTSSKPLSISDTNYKSQTQQKPQEKIPVQSSQKKNEKFDRKEEAYKPIRITIIVLSVINYLIESAYASSVGKAANPLAVLITYFITTYFVRKIYLKNKDFDNKVLITISIYVAVYLVKTIVGLIIRSLLLN
jgi:cation transport ATPase